MKLSSDETKSLRGGQDAADIISVWLNTERPCAVTDYFSCRGGWPEEEYYEVQEVVHYEGAIEALCWVQFEETEPSGCPEMPRGHSRSGTFRLRVDVNTGTVEFSFAEERLYG